MVSPSAATACTCSTGVGRSRKAASYSPAVDARERLVHVARVAQPALMRDVVLAHPERLLEHQLLEHGGVEPAIGVAVAGQRPLDRLG